MAFTKFGLSPAILQGVKAMGYLVPTPIQVRTIPLVLQGRDVIGSAQTGTGKTAAFALPILSLLDRHQPKSRCLVLEPTRELAAQVETAFYDFARFTNLHTAVLYGGVGYGKQMDALGRGADIIVATPGRLLDHMERGTCRLDEVKYLVLDEADRMLDMGFLPDVRRIVQKVPARAAHPSVWGDHSAGNRHPVAVGDEEPGNGGDRRPADAGRNRVPCPFTRWPKARRRSCCSPCWTN